MANQKFLIKGMTCSACSNHVENAVNKLNGIYSVNVNLLANSMDVSYDESLININDIINAVTDEGYGAALYSNTLTKINENSKKTKIQLILSVILLIPLMIVSMGHMFGLHLFDNKIIQGIVELIILTPILILNRKYFINGFKSLFMFKPNMDSLIALGSGISVIYSIFNMINSSINHINTHYYFESAGMILTFITIGKYLESKSKNKTSSAIKQLINLTPQKAIIEVNGAEKEIPTDAIKPNDVVICKNGMSIPVDGKIIFGNCSIDESAITGESIPVDKSNGDNVVGGTVISSGYVKIIAEHTGDNTTLAKIIKLVEDATSSKAPIARIADKVASVFVPLVLLIALFTTIVWLLVGAEFSKAISFGIAVLVISCPCALGLATPTAIMVGTGKAAQLGILIKSAQSLETANKIKTVVLDKTGTITKGEPEVTDVIPNIDEKKFIKIAYSLENNSEHPLSKAIVKYAKKYDAPLMVTENFKSHTGSGISGNINGINYYAGNYQFIKEIYTDLDNNSYLELYSSGKTPLFFASKDKLLGVIAVADTIKETSKEAILKLNSMGIETVMLTGDNKDTANAIQKSVGIKTAYAQLLPNQKEQIVREYMSNSCVAMVGDGINDSPALVTADVGIAIGAGTDIAIDSADIVLMKSDLEDVVTTIQLSKAVLRNIKENLFWAFIYNIICIPLAAGAFYALLHWQLQPMFGTIAMSLSSICVVTNALRLKNFKPKKILLQSNNNIQYKTIVINQNSKIKGEKSMKKIIIDGMMCEHCKARVEQILSEISNNVSVDLETKTALVEDTTPNEEIIKRINGAGYSVIECK